jgi:hypothetical protein
MVEDEVAIDDIIIFDYLSFTSPHLFSKEDVDQSVSLLSLLKTDDKTEIKKFASNPTNSTDSADNHQICVKRKRRRKNFVPRLLKQDIRRMYSRLFTNVLNSGDLNLAKKFINEFFIERNINFIMSASTSIFENEVDATIKILRTDDFCSFLSDQWTALPDYVNFLNETIVTINHDFTATIQCSFVVLATVIFNQTIMNSIIKPYITTTTDVFNDEVSSGENLKLLDNPMTIKLEGTFKMFIDENKNIIKIVIQVSQNKN